MGGKNNLDNSNEKRIKKIREGTEVSEAEKEKINCEEGSKNDYEEKWRKGNEKREVGR